MFLSTGRQPLSFPLDGVAVGEGGFEAVEKVWHCVLAPLVTVLEYGLGRQVARQGEDEPTQSRLLNKHSFFLMEGPSPLCEGRLAASF